MNSINCLYCGKIVKKNTIYCNDICKEKYNVIINSDLKPNFYNFKQAASFYGRDFRTIKKFEGLLFTIDKNLHAPNTKWITCRCCKKPSPSSKARGWCCKECSSKNLGRKAQGQQISKMYAKEGNPNYLNGMSKTSEYQSNDWYKLKKELNFTKCGITGIEEKIDYHHIIPRWFCKVANIDIFDRNNIIGLNHEYHKAVHHLQLDVLLLPILYSSYKKDALQLRSHFVHLALLNRVHQHPVDQLRSQDLFQISRYPGRKKLLNLLPEFLQPFLGHQES